MRAFVFAFVNLNASRGIFEELFSRTLWSGMRFFTKFDLGYVMTRFSNDVTATD